MKNMLAAFANAQEENNPFSLIKLRLLKAPQWSEPNSQVLYKTIIVTTALFKTSDWLRMDGEF